MGEAPPHTIVIPSMAQATTESAQATTESAPAEPAEPAPLPRASRASPSPGLKPRKKRARGRAQAAMSGTRTLIGPGLVNSKNASSPSFSMGTSERPKPRHPVSPGPVFYPKPTSKWLGDAPSYSFSGEFGPEPALRQQEPPEGTLTKEQIALLKEDTTPIPRRFNGAGAPANNPGPGQYRVHAQFGFGRSFAKCPYTQQILSKNRSSPQFSLATRARPPRAVTVSPGPAAYTTGNTAVGRQPQARHRSHGGFAFGGEQRGYQMPYKYTTPGPGAHVV